MSETKPAPRTYNETHVPRKYAEGRRRVSVYVSWSYPGEANQDVTVMDNRGNTVTEIRQVNWPRFEWADPMTTQQGIAGAMELLLQTWIPFTQLVEEAIGHRVPMFQRVNQGGYQLPLDERVLADADTLLVFGVDVLRAQQRAAPEEIEAVRQFLTREGTCLIISPHHDVGRSDDLKGREMEHVHHGDPLVPGQQRTGMYTRSLMRGLGVPVENRWGLRPAVAEGTLAPLSIRRDLDTRGWLEGVTSLNFHPHMPHYALTTEDTKSIHVLARQPIDMSKPHPFTLAGNQEFNAVIWMPPSGDRAGDVLLVDSAQLATFFGATASDSLKRFWLNIAK